ncbi:hypothetical protein N44_00674 [Microcystis aeruginosa NIES-44]|uniref:Uncharacterized protein n=1 Tax=Microcystis aeruginosa NIES-44 TaxID=449439 RepID=A0A0A1VNR9_MICAE|nr:hypothetical protein N44_00674 [Microcystis aeruginosa NIES-44]
MITGLNPHKVLANYPQSFYQKIWVEKLPLLVESRVRVCGYQFGQKTQINNPP